MVYNKLVLSRSYKRALLSTLIFSAVAGVCTGSAFAEEQVDFSITVNPSLSLSVSSSAVNLEITPVQAGAFGKTDFSVSSATNNMYGYTITMTNGTTYLESTTVNPTTGTKPQIETLATGGITEATFSSATTAADGLNKWGIAIDTGNYDPASTTATTIKETDTNNTAGADVTTINVASKLNLEVPAGTYTDTFNFQMVAKVPDPTLFYIMYNNNGGTGTMSPSTISYEDTITLPTSTFAAPEGYVFDGWASSAAGAGPYYEDGGSFTAPAATSGETYKVFYATWKPTGTPTPTGGEAGEGDGGGAGTGVTLQRAYEMAYSAMHKGMYEETTAGSNTYQYIDSWNGGTYQGEGRDVRFLIQDMTPEICATATDIGSTALVLDIRDQTSYRIVKAADGRCWMQDNLALDLTAANASTNITTANTNADADSLTSLFSGNRANGGQYATAGVSNWTSSYRYSAPLINVSNKDVLPTTYNNTDEPLASTVTSENWKVGVYYNYCAASAGSYCYGSGGTSASTTDSTAVDKVNTAIDAEYDICPSGWRMPTGYSYDATSRPDGGEYQTLVNAYPSISGGDNQYTRVRKALRLPLSGSFNGGSAFNQGSNGFFWSSTYYDSSRMYRLYISKLDISPQSIYGRELGHSVRCIAR